MPFLRRDHSSPMAWVKASLFRSTLRPRAIPRVLARATTLAVLAFWAGQAPALAQTYFPQLPANAMELSLADSIRIALSNNKTIKAAYLDRVVQKFDLRVAEDKFTPKGFLTSNVNRGQTSSNSGGAGPTNVTGNTVNLGATVNQLVPTGARIVATGLQSASKADGTEVGHARGWNITLTQPLLRGAGFSVNAASVVTAQLGEQNNILSLKSTLMDTLSSVISAYRAYVRALKSLEIARQSVVRAKELLGINRVLIAAGRMAEIDIVQSEADVANQELNLLTTENSTDSARLALVKLLDIDINTQIRPQDNVDIETSPYALEQAKQLALVNRPDYQSLLLGIQTSRLRLLLAEDNKLPDLSLSTGYGRSALTGGLPGTAGTSGNWSVGLSLSVPFGDLSYQQLVVSAKIDLEKNELNLIKQRESIEIEVQNAVRNVEVNLRQVSLAQRSRELAERKFSIETEKLKVGRSSNFQLVSFQNDLVNAQNNELNTAINYLEALTSLERSLGVLLDKWGVTLVQR